MQHVLLDMALLSKINNSCHRKTTDKNACQSNTIKKAYMYWTFDWNTRDNVTYNSNATLRYDIVITIIKAVSNCFVFCLHSLENYFHQKSLVSESILLNVTLNNEEICLQINCVAKNIASAVLSKPSKNICPSSLYYWNVWWLYFQNCPVYMWRPFKADDYPSGTSGRRLNVANFNVLLCFGIVIKIRYVFFNINKVYNYYQQINKIFI